MDITNLGLTECCRGREWDYKPFVDIARDILLPIRESSGDGFRFFHSCRVFQLVSQMCYYPELQKLEEDVNWPVLKIAALFHDMGVRVLYDRLGFLSVMDNQLREAWVSTHAELGVALVIEHLSPLLFREELDEVCYLVSKHDCYDLEGGLALKLLQDADNLDEKGVQHIYRMATVGHNHERSLVESCKFYFENNAHPHEQSYKVFHLPSTRTLAKRRSSELHKSMLGIWQQTHGLDIPYSAESFPWEAWEERIREKGYIIDHPAGSVHPRFQSIIYPVDYGYIPSVPGWDGADQDIFVGNPEGPLVGIILTADFLKGDREFKLLWGLSDTQVKTVHDFFNRKPLIMTGMLVERTQGGALCSSPWMK